MAVADSNLSKPLPTPPNNLVNVPGSDLDSSGGQHSRILVIDDDPDFITMTKIILCQAGFDVAGALGCNAALEKCPEVKPDVVLLDLMMPDVDGFETYERLKKVTNAPVIVVTANGDRENAARSLQMGMEDYISKPFLNSEMVARVKAAIRRAKKSDPETLQVFPEVELVVKFDTQEVFLHDKFIRLVPRQFMVFSILAQHAPRPVTYATVTEKVWGEDTPKKRAHLKNIIFSIRQKLETEPANPRLLINYRNLGYRLMTQVETYHS
ncbi:MAG: response regulator transcription factor [Chloroflexota bacterium]